MGKTCGETFELVRFHGVGAVCGNGCGLRAGKILPAQRGLLFSSKMALEKTCEKRKKSSYALLVFNANFVCFCTIVKDENENFCL